MVWGVLLWAGSNRINGVLSSKLIVNNGVPQGSVLGPIVFLLYINDTSNSSKILDFFLFADDTSLLYSNKNMDELEYTLNREQFIWTHNGRIYLRKSENSPANVITCLKDLQEIPGGAPDVPWWVTFVPDVTNLWVITVRQSNVTFA